MTVQPFPTPLDIQMIVTDVDGTLLESTHTLPPTSRTFQALRRLRAAHPTLPLIISTGKQRRATAALRAQLDLHAFPSCHLNGNAVYSPDGAVLHESGLPPGVVARVLAAVRGVGVGVGVGVGAGARAGAVAAFVYDHDRAYQLAGDARWGEVLRGYGEELVPAVEGTAEGVPEGMPAVKMAVCWDAERIHELRALLQAFAQDAGFALTQALPFCVEVVPAAHNKGTALRTLLKSYYGGRIDARNVVAFGDGENDVSMFRVAGMSVAMGNAMDVAREEATWSTASNDEGGVGAFLESVFWPVEN